MKNFKIYHEGQYDLKANLKLKFEDTLDTLRSKALEKLNEVDYYFVHH